MHGISNIKFAFGIQYFSFVGKNRNVEGRHNVSKILLINTIIIYNM